MSESQTPIYDALAKEYKLTDYEIINGRPEAVAEDRIDLFEEDTVRPEAFEVAEIEHQAIQPPAYEAPTHNELLIKSIEASPHLVLVKDINDVGVTLGSVRRSQLAA